MKAVFGCKRQLLFVFKRNFYIEYSFYPHKHECIKNSYLQRRWEKESNFSWIVYLSSACQYLLIWHSGLNVILSIKWYTDVQEEHEILWYHHLEPLGPVSINKIDTTGVYHVTVPTYCIFCQPNNHITEFFSTGWRRTIEMYGNKVWSSFPVTYTRVQ